MSEPWHVPDRLYDMDAGAIAAEFNSWGARPKPGEQWPTKPAPLGAPGDLRTAALLDAVRAGSPAFREAVAAGIDDGGAGALIISAVRLAALAVRTGDRAHLERALLALAVAVQGTADYRDVLMALDVPAHSARLIGVDPAALYAEVAAIAPAYGAEGLRRNMPRATSPLRPSPGRKVGGYLESEDENGFRYVRRPIEPPRPEMSALAINRFGAGPLDDATEAVAPLTHVFDQALIPVLDAILRTSAASQAKVSAALNEEGKQALSVFARRAAALAVRTGDRAHLNRALLALGLAIEAAAADPAALAALAFPWRSAQLMGLDPAAVFAAAAGAIPPRASAVLRRFAEDARGGIPLGATGFSEGADEDGFRYVRARPGPPLGTDRQIG